MSEIDCPKCEGWGRVEIATNWGKSWCDDPGYQEEKCEVCNGTGKVEDEVEE